MGGRFEDVAIRRTWRWGGGVVQWLPNCVYWGSGRVMIFSRHCLYDKGKYVQVAYLTWAEACVMEILI